MLLGAGGQNGNSGYPQVAALPTTNCSMRLRLALVLLWTLSSLILLFLIVALIFRQTNFPLNLGLIRTAGRTGLWLTLLPALWGLTAVCLLFIRRKLGVKLLGIYSAFWLAILLSGLPAVWNARRSFCLQSIHFCITTPWLGRLTVFALAVPFLLVALWSHREVVRPEIYHQDKQRQAYHSRAGRH